MEALITLILVFFAILGAPLFAIFGAASMMLFSESGGSGSMMPPGQEVDPITFAVVDVFSLRFADSPQLVTLPLFTFAGYLLAESGTPKRLVRVTRALSGESIGELSARSGNAWSAPETAVYNGVFSDHRFAGGETVKIAKSERYEARSAEK